MNVPYHLLTEFNTNLYSLHISHTNFVKMQMLVTLSRLLGSIRYKGGRCEVIIRTDIEFNSNSCLITNTADVFNYEIVYVHQWPNSHLI